MTDAAVETDWRQRHAHDLMASYAPPLRLLVRGEGCWVWDDEGTRYLDFLGGIAVNSLGHAHPVVVAAVEDQVRRLVHISNYFASPSQLELAERLKRITGAGDAGRVYFGNSGAEANEAAFKLARRTGRPRILALKNAFHGRTMGALALTGKPALQGPFEPLPAGVEHIDSTVEALEQAIRDDVAMLIVEPIKGETGVVPLPAGYLRAARELTERSGALLVIDEIQTGLGRTGAWFDFQHEGVVPDAVTMAKGIAGGVPLGAMVTFGAASGLLQRGDHGSTFGGNPLATAAANAVLGEIERADLVGNAARRGEQIRAAVEAMGSPLVTEVRGRGLLIGVGTTDGAAPAIGAAALEAGLIVNPINPTSIRIAPPLIVGDEEVEAFTERFAAALAAS
ncbi:acetylornithine transaminase [Amnibacterium setariae]|uniref:Acetylornithine transaminase n=1 Tax=Amnibacterium setariae TaxID=2306585 RepID=A0A3A1U3Z3_9MICO|nr:acetylornithine transaminase [Amnibacterium setariae]RIX31261.1 acetylornithine transaminase [Amnibacterium setariae]